MNQKEAFDFLDSLIDYEKITTYAYDAMKLNRMRLLLDALGNPQDSFQSIHVAGSRGKGSTCAMVYSILREAGFSVGIYTSPHLMTRNERIRIAREGEDRMISDQELAHLVEKVKPVIEQFSKDGAEGVTFFEIFTALSFLFFKEQGVKIAVLEVGMGGRLDATNVVRPLVTAITPISYDHMDKLGKTLTEIAREKAHIFKKGALAVVSHQDPESLAEIRRVASKKKVKPLDVSSSYSYRIFDKREEGTHFDVRGPQGELINLFLPLLGEHQVRNALVAIAICDALQQKGIVISRKFLRKGLSTVHWPGRFQIVQKDPVILLDGAQNGASALALKETFLDFFEGRRLSLILGISANKDVESVCKFLCPLAENIIVTQSQTVRALNVDQLSRYVYAYSRSLQIIPSLEEALGWASRRAQAKEVILVTGSLYLVGEALALLDKEENERMGRERMSQSKTHSPTLPHTHPQT